MKSLQGQLLIASPRLVDPNFFRAVILVVEHNDQGALGLILNRPLKLGVEEAWGQISQSPCRATGKLYQGGPCDGPLMVLHADENLAQKTIMEGLFFSTEKEAVEALVAAEAGWRQFFVGYAGWSPGQLESEMEEGGWLTSATDLTQIQAGSDDRWNQLRKLVARAAAFPWIDPKIFPKDPSNN